MATNYVKVELQIIRHGAKGRDEEARNKVQTQLKGKIREQRKLQMKKGKLAAARRCGRNWPF
eukprot:414395-Amphidinium_carterae.1